MDHDMPDGITKKFGWGGARPNTGGARPGAGRPRKIRPAEIIKTEVPVVEQPVLIQAEPKPERIPSPPKPIKLPAIRTVEATDDALLFLVRVMNDQEAPLDLRVRAATTAAQYQHVKAGDGGKKDARQEAAEKVASSGKFQPAQGPLKLVGGA